MRFGPVEIGLILVIILIIFGVGKLPKVAGSLGKGIHEFRQAVKGEEGTRAEEDKSSDQTKV